MRNTECEMRNVELLLAFGLWLLAAPWKAHELTSAKKLPTANSQQPVAQQNLES